MSTYIDKIIIYIMGVGLIYKHVNVPYDIVYLLLGVILFSITCYLDNSENTLACEIVYGILIAVSIFLGKMYFFVPILIFSIMYRLNRKWKYTIFYIFTTVGINIYFATCGVFEFTEIFWVVGVSIFAGILGYKENTIAIKDSQIKKIRDDTTEANNYLEEKNKILSNNMENEIRIATLSERNRIAREIHDNVGHMLSRSILQLGAVMTINKNENIYSQLLPLKESLDNAMNNVRESVHDLHKESFDINQAAKVILDELLDFEVDYKSDMSAGADKEIKYTFITILKEAVTNIEKYCKGNKVKVVINELEEHYQMLVEDNGKVENDRFHSKAGIGLTNMEDRVKKLGGIINFSSEKGFRIFISIPKKVTQGENSNS